MTVSKIPLVLALVPLLEAATGPELDAALRTVLQHIEDDDLMQALQVLPEGTRRTLREMLEKVEAQSAEIEDAVIRREKDKARRSGLSAKP